MSDKPLKISKRCARLEALASAAACLKHHRFSLYDGERIREDDELTGDAWDKVDAERRRIVAALAKQAGVAVEDLLWEGV